MSHIVRSFGLWVVPETPPDDLFKGVELACAEAKRAYKPTLRDGYHIKVDLVSVGKFKSFEEASKLVMAGNRRHLTVGELLALNLADGGVRHRYSVFAGTFVLEYQLMEYHEDTQSANKKWGIGLSDLHRGLVLDRNSVFAVTQMPRFESWTERDFENLISLPQNDTPRLMT